MDFNISFIASIFVKSIAIVGLAVYLIFAFIMVRQEHLMANVVEEAFEPVLKLLVYIHLIAAIGLILLAIVIL